MSEYVGEAAVANGRNHKIINLMWIFSGNYGNVLFSVLSFLVYAYFLSPEQFGIGIFCIAIVESFGVIYGSTIEDPLVRRPKLLHTDISSAFWLGGILSLLTTAAVLGMVAFSAYEFIPLLAFCFVKLTLSTLCRPMIAMCRKLRQFKLLSIRTLVARFMGTGVGITVAVQGGGEWALVSQAVFIEVFSLLVLLKVSHGYLSAPISLSAFKHILSEGLPIGLKAMFWSMLTRGTIIVLGLLTSPTVLGYFAFANRLVRLPLSASTNSLNSYALPVLADKVNTQQDVGDFFNRITLATQAIFCPIFLLASVLAPFFIPMIFSAKWQDSVLIFQCLSVIFGLKFAVLYVSKTLAAHGKAKLGLKLEFFNLCVFFIILFIAGAQYGGLAAVLALAIHAVADMCIKTYSLSRVVTLNYATLAWGLLRIVTSCLLMMLAAWQSWHLLTASQLMHPVLVLLSAAVIGLGTYLVLMALVYARCFALIKGLLSK